MLPRSLPIGSVLLLLACDALEFEYVGAQKLAGGRHEIYFDVSEGRKQLAVSASRSASGEPATRIIAYDDEGDCETSPAQVIAAWRILEDDRLAFGLFGPRRDDRSRPLRMVDSRCRPIGRFLDVTGTSWPRATPGLLISTTGGRVEYYDGLERSRHPIATDAAVLRSIPAEEGSDDLPSVWLIEAERLVRRELPSGAERERLPGRVLEAYTGSHIDAAGDYEFIAYETPAGIWLARNGTEGGLEAFAARRIAEGGCELRVEDATDTDPSSSAIEPVTRHIMWFYEPCEARRLVGVDVHDGARRAGPEGVRSYIPRSDIGVLYYETGSEEAVAPWLQVDGEQPVQLAQRLTGTMTRGLPDDGLTVVTHEDRLGRLQLDGTFQPVINNVRGVRFMTRHAAVLHGGDDDAARLSFVERATLEVNKRFSRVPLSAWRRMRPSALRSYTRDYSLILHSMDEQGLGTLTLFEDFRAATRRIDQGVRQDGYQGFAAYIRGDLTDPFRDQATVAYIRDSAGEQALIALLLATGQARRVDTSVTSLQATRRLPRPGLLYTISDGEREGLWFAPQ